MDDATFRLVVTGGVAMAALSMVVMAIVTIVLAKTVSRLQTRMESLADRTEPVVDSVRHVVVDNGPKLSAILTSAVEAASNAKDVTTVMRDQAHKFAEVGTEMAEVGRDIAERAKVKVARVDAAVDQTVEQVQNLSSNVVNGVRKPISEFAGVMAGLRAGFSTYAAGRRPSPARATADEEMFI